TYIDSEGVEITDALYKSLEQAHRNLGRKLERLHQDFPQLGTLVPTADLTQPVIDARNHLDEAIIQAVTPDQDWQQYEKLMTDRISSLYRHIDRILQHIDHRLDSHRQQESRRLTGFVGGLTLLILLFLVMFYAFYRN